MTDLQATFVSQWFPPEPAAVPEGIVRALQSRGIRTNVLTGLPNYPSGQLHSGYRMWTRRRSVVNGMSVQRTPLFPSHDGSSLLRIVNYLSWALTSLLLGRRAFRGSDVSVVYSTPVTAGLAAHFRRRRIPMVLVVQDVWPDSIFASGFLSRGLIRRVVEPLVQWASTRHYRLANRIAVIAPGMRDLLIDRGVAPERIEVVFNWADARALSISEPDPDLRDGCGIPADNFVVMYAGNHGAAQNLDVAIEAVRKMVGLDLVLVGDGIKKKSLIEQARGVPNVHFLDRVDVARIGSLMAAADAQLISLADEPLFRITMPSKVQASLATGSLIVAAAPGDTARVIVSSGAGVTCQPGDARALARALASLVSLTPGERDAMRRRGRNYYEENMSEAVGGARLAALVRAAAAEDRSNRS